MKTSKALTFGATLTAAFLTNQNVGATNLAAVAEVASASVHRLIVASPHGLEEFPWLLREASVQTRATERSQNVLSEIKKNRALAASPRMREQFPELVRAGWPPTDVSSKARTGPSQLDQVIKNRALAASPRMKEQFHELVLGYNPQTAQNPVQVAPLK
jgi:hypothetical protein